MKKIGHIRIIDQKVYFEYYEIMEPNYAEEIFESFEIARLIEVVNAKRHGNLYLIGTKEGKHIGLAENNQKCKAEITGDTCTVIELL